MSLLLSPTGSAASWLPRQEDVNSTSTTSTPSNTTESFDPDAAFPTDVGFAGITKEGVSPFLVETDRLNGTLKDSSVENRWNATDSDDFDLFKSLGNTVSFLRSAQVRLR